MYFNKYLEQVPNVFTNSESELIRAVLPALRDWYVQAGSGGMSATDTLNRNAFLLGGVGADTLTGGAGNDLLVGNRGDDTLTADGGNDCLDTANDADWKVAA